MRRERTKTWSVSCNVDVGKKNSMIVLLIRSRKNILYLCTDTKPPPVIQSFAVLLCLDCIDVGWIYGATIYVGAPVHSLNPVVIPRVKFPPGTVAFPSCPGD